MGDTFGRESKSLTSAYKEKLIPVSASGGDAETGSERDNIPFFRQQANRGEKTRSSSHNKEGAMETESGEEPSLFSC